jgi:hypothetical protein
MFIGWNCFCIGEGLNTWAQISNHGRAYTQSWDFFTFRNSDRLAIPSAGEKTQYSMETSFFRQVG